MVDAVPTAFKDQAPYVLGLAELAEGPKVFAWVDKSIKEDSISIGLKMKMKPTRLSNGNWTIFLSELGST